VRARYRGEGKYYFYKNVNCARSKLCEVNTRLGEKAQQIAKQVEVWKSFNATTGCKYNKIDMIIIVTFVILLSHVSIYCISSDDFLSTWNFYQTLTKMGPL
jgi:hypothetical protein